MNERVHGHRTPTTRRALLGALKMAYDLWAAWSTLREKEAQRRRFANEGTDDVKKWTLV